MKSFSSPKSGGYFNRSGSRHRKKSKKLAAICEEEFKRNLEKSKNRDNLRSADTASEPRRSNRVRKAPQILDASPLPPKRRPRIEPKVKLNTDGFRKADETENMDDLDTEGDWKRRLRSRRRRRVVFQQRKGSAPRGKRKLFHETIFSKAEEQSERIQMEGSEESDEKMPKKRKFSRESSSLVDEEQETGKCVVQDESRCFGGEIKENIYDPAAGYEASIVDSGNENGFRNDKIETDVSSSEASLEDEKKSLHVEQVGEEGISTGNVDLGPQTSEGVDQEDNEDKLGEEHENQQNVAPVGDNFVNDAQYNNTIGEKDLSTENSEGKDAEAEVHPTVDKSNCTSTSEQHFRQERRCGLCGGGTDGKPPKKLVRGAGESDIEACYGCSASEEPNYDQWDGFGDEPGWLGRLLGPINDRYGIAGIWVHQHCAVWSPEVYFADLRCLKNVRAALCRGRTLKCTRCGRPGATIGCRVDRCPKTYHLPCARANGCIFDHRKFLIACTDHRHLFQPHGIEYGARVKKLKAKKMKLEIRKLSNEASRKDIEAEEKWLENCGEDEEFLKRENKRLHRDLLRITPIYIGGSESESGKQYEGWDSIAGLQHVINCMKEVVSLPLLYPEFFDNLGLTPPRGVLLHGYPGTGKTLVVRALIGALARGNKRIAYFARKGADCLGKYVGDAERQLRLLFQVAEKCQPSIIFFDEIDGLAPRRMRQQDQTHSSVVSTLLALMDGLKSRGSVVVIGATNRPDAVDPALRRPGRFDREIYFPLPSMEDRAAIVSLHTKSWPKPVAGPLLAWIAKKTIGFAGADLQALCTQAAMIALKRNFPWHEILSAVQVKSSGAKSVALPEFLVEESDWLEALSSSPPPCSRREAGIAANDIVSSPLPMHLVPSLLQPLSALLVFFHLDERLWLPPSLSKAIVKFRSLMFSVLGDRGLPSDKWWTHIDDVLKEEEVALDIVREVCYGGILIQECYISSSDARSDVKSDLCGLPDPSLGSRDHDSTWSYSPIKHSGFRVLITGGPRSGQRHLASCILHCFVGNIEVQKVDLATISQEGGGDLIQGVTQILIRCASGGSCLLFMPRIDLWALESGLTEENRPPSSEPSKSNAEFDNVCLRQSELAKGGAVEPQSLVNASRAWSSFVEQVESLSVSTSIMILGTSEVPYDELPEKIKLYFKSDSTKCSKQRSSVPQFNVSVRENFNHTMAIDVSALELSMMTIQAYVHLLHQGAHASFHKNCNRYNSVENATDSLDQSKDHDSGKDIQDNSEPPDGSNKLQSSPNSRNLKAKSSLLLAISTLGYQILQYPHFAELCWVTSKLKEGPCADVRGPWKKWPFNSCIIRPCNSLPKYDFSSRSSNEKRKKASCVVRGLIAIGLSAYRGIYSSAREVSFEVRKVLGLLIAQIDAKIDTGKNRYHYLRLVSQVAFLEDMVNSWAYALRELDSQTQITSSKPFNTFQINQLLPNDSDEVCQKADALELDLQAVDDRAESDTLEKNHRDAGDLEVFAIVRKQTDISSNVSQDTLPNVSTKNADCEDMNKERGIICNSEVIATDPEDGSNQHMCLPDDPLISSASHVPGGPNSISSNLENIKGMLGSKVDNPVVCTYHCCSECLRSLQDLMQKLLVQEWGLNCKNSTAEDIHDAVVSIFVSLVSKVNTAISCSTAGVKLGRGNSKNLLDCIRSHEVPCRNSGDEAVDPVECQRHSIERDASKAGIFTSRKLGFDPVFKFRDGILVPVDSRSDLSSHCKFENLCLCSIYSIVSRIPTL